MRRENRRDRRPAERPNTIAASQYLPGRNAIRELLTRAPERIRSLLYADGGGAAPDREEILAAARSAGVSVQIVKRERLDEISEGAVHQSFVAELTALPEGSLTDLIEQAEKSERPILLFLDSIHDPHNLGAILRAAECFGVQGVVWSRNRGASITPTVRKVSVGASELVPQVVIGNLADGVRKVKEAGFWVVTAELGPESVPLPRFESPQRVALILGSEGEGVQPLLRKLADFRVQIPMRGAIDSLNVSQATAVLLYGLREGGFTRNGA